LRGKVSPFLVLLVLVSSLSTTHTESKCFSESRVPGLSAFAGLDILRLLSEGGSGWSNISMKVGRCVPVANRLALTWEEEDVVGFHPLFVVSIPLLDGKAIRKYDMVVI
jgi:hypothetical protein